ncbi:flagellin, partial [Bradyrhizobium sp. dw_411]|uniref:flagellin n=1 Tax=Bradyrhizobium sp. dw_411 TaxID=2720082 RepID=UPI0023DFE8E5
ITGSSGANAATIAAGKITLHTGTAADLSITSSNNAALGALGLGTGVTQARTPGTGGLSGETLTIGATNSSSTATAITFGTGTGQISTLNGLNAALASNDLQATLDASTGKINIVTTNNAASSTIKALSGTATVSGSAFANAAAGGSAPVLDPNSQATRASLVTQYNNVLQQINTTSQDSSFNGVNLLSGDTLNLTFDETGASKLAIAGVTFNDAGLGLSSLTSGTDFLDNNSANTALTELTKASTTLRTEATSLGSNLSIVQIRQDFNKNLIDVLQTGSSNLTLADTNEEAANSQALSTRQSIAVSALSLANQSQQSVLQLLR